MGHALPDINSLRVFNPHLDPERPMTPMERLYDGDAGKALEFFDHLIDRELNGNDTLYHLVIDSLKHSLIKAEAKRWSEEVANANYR